VSLSPDDISKRFAVGIEALTLMAAAAFVIAYVLVALQRLAYPFDLEWMEGSMVHHVSRVLDGKPVYAPPTLDYIPFLYPPLYYYVSAAAARLTGLTFLPLRLVSLTSSLVMFWLVYRLTARDSGSRYAGALAVGLFAATYRIGGAWFDLARNDSLFLALVLAAIYLIRFRESWAGWASAGLLIALAALTKQTALIMAPSLLLYVAIVDWRKALALILVFALALGAATWTFNAGSHGWYVYYVFRLPSRIGQAAAERAPFWTHDIFTTLPVASVLAAATLIAVRPWRDRRSAFWPLVALSALGAAWVSRLHSGAYENVLIPAYLCLAVLAGLAGRQIPRRVPVQYGMWARATIAALCVMQLFLLRYSIAAQVPTAHDTELAVELGNRLAGSRGEVFAPFHSYIPTPAGPVMHAHSWAVIDILRAGDSAAAATLTGEIKYAFDQGVFRMVVIDKIEPWMEPDFDQWYRRSEPVVDPRGLWTRTGYRTQPRWIYVPTVQRPLRITARETEGDAARSPSAQPTAPAHEDR
jgi:hypothetical protein